MNSNSKKKKIVTLILTILICSIITILVYHFLGKPLMDILKDPSRARKWVVQQGLWSRLLFVLGCAIQVIIAIIPGGPFEVGAGFAFGPIEGTILSMIGLTLGSLIVFTLVKRFGMKFICIFFSEEKVRNLKIFNNQKRLKIVTFIAFLIPGTPKDLLTYVAGLSPMDWKSWMLLTTIARLPAVVVSTLGGHAIGDREYKTAIIIMVVATVLSVIGYKIFHRMNQDPDPKSSNLPNNSSEKE